MFSTFGTVPYGNVILLLDGIVPELLLVELKIFRLVRSILKLLITFRNV